MILSKKICLWAVFICTTGSAVAQSIKINWSQPIEYDKKYHMYSFFGDAQNGFAGFFLGLKGDAFIQGLNAQAKQRYQKEVGVPVPPGISVNDKFSLYRILYLNGKPYVFVSYYNKKQDTRYLLYFTINNDGISDENLTEVSRIEDIGKYEGDFTIVKSDDASKIAVYSRGKINLKENVSYNVQVFDNNMKKLWGKNIELSYPNKSVELGIIEVDNDGNVGISGTASTDGKAINPMNPSKSKLFLSVWFGKTDVVKEYKIDMEDNLKTYALTFRFDNAHKSIIIMGLCNVIGHHSKAELEQAGFDKNYGGYLYANIDEYTQTVLKRKVGPISKEVIEGYKKYFHMSAPVYSGLALYMLPNGNLLVTAEPNYVTNGVSYSSLAVTMYLITANGDLQWMSELNKNQSMVEEYPLSHITIQDGNKLHLLYNDNPKNIDIPISTGSKVLTDPSKSVVVDAMIDEKGNITKHIIPGNDEDGNPIFIDPSYSYQIDYKTYAVIGDIFNGHMNASHQTTYHLGFIDIPNAVPPATGDAKK